MSNSPKIRSNYRGVYWHEARQKWRSQLNVLCHTFFLGEFEDEVDAAREYDLAVRYASPYSKRRRLGLGAESEFNFPAEQAGDSMREASEQIKRMLELCATYASQERIPSTVKHTGLAGRVKDLEAALAQMELRVQLLEGQRHAAPRAASVTLFPAAELVDGEPVAAAPAKPLVTKGGVTIQFLNKELHPDS